MIFQMCTLWLYDSHSEFFFFFFFFVDGDPFIFALENGFRHLTFLCITLYMFHIKLM
jgi:hypothetical protein